MLNERLIVKTSPKANVENLVYWQDYRVTVLTERLFRLEKSPQKKFRDEATQAVWFRYTSKQDFKLEGDDAHAVIETSACRLILYKERGQVCVEIGDTRRSLDNYGNLLGTYRTLDCCDGDVYSCPWLPDEKPYHIQLGKGVCSKTGVAVLEDSDSLTLGEDGMVKPEKANGTDEYVFVFGDDYRGAVRALYMLTGQTSLVPRFALGNWWSRYHEYTDEEYLRVFNRFEDENIPFSVATVDMDWHYSKYIDQELSIAESGKNTLEHLGAANSYGWTGYTWNRRLFPNPQEFLADLHSRDLKVTLNLHPALGIRWWEDCYQNMANAMGMDASKGYQIPFDFTYDRFINAYFDLVHTPLEEMGVDFWWMDWQQPNIEWHDDRNPFEKAANPITEKYDPLWALNHYHYFANARTQTVPMVLSRYSGIGSHRYPVGFSGDTTMTWHTLAYLPYFTATASNVGYTWWSHDIGGHFAGEKSNELFVRHVQYGVFSPINRLHCSFEETITKEPWAYGSAGLVAAKFLRFRHQLVPYLYTANYLNCVEGRALIEPLYYEWKEKQAYSYKEEYRFGSELLVAPVTQKGYPDGFARVRAWIPEGKWTDIFTGDEYEVGEGGKDVVLLRDLNSIPVLAKKGAILPLSADCKNGTRNPQKMESWAYEGTNTYTMYEDGLENKQYSVLFTEFKSEYIEGNGVDTQTLIIFAHGDNSVCPVNREMKVCFKNIESGRVRLFVDGEAVEYTTRVSDCLQVIFPFDGKKTYKIEVLYTKKTRLQKIIERAKKVLSEAEGDTILRQTVWEYLEKVQTVDGFLATVDGSALDYATKLRLKETVL